MECENCEGPEVRALLRAVPVVAIFAAVGMGACAKRRHHLHSQEEAHSGRDHDHGHGAHWRHHEDEHEHEHEDLRHGRRGYGPLRRGMDPVRILERRFASGEIDEDEFRRRRHALADDVA